MASSRQGTHFIAPAEGALTVFTDGSSLPTPRRGGIGIRFVYCDRLGRETAWDLTELGVAGATNNQMELLAVITERGRRDLEVRGASKNRAPAGPLDEACAGERTLAGQLSAAWNLEIENKLAKQIESFVG